MSAWSTTVVKWLGNGGLHLRPIHFFRVFAESSGRILGSEGPRATLIGAIVKVQVFVTDLADSMPTKEWPD
jgi:hypothetical protein